MNDDNFRDWLKKYLKKHLEKWMQEIDEVMMKAPKNWPQKIEVDLPCECCGEMIKVPFRVNRFRSFSHLDWPYYIEYRSPSLHRSICPKCKRPFRLDKATPATIQ